MQKRHWAGRPTLRFGRLCWRRHKPQIEMIKQLISHYYLEVAIILSTITLATLTYVFFVNLTEHSTQASIIDSRGCHTKNSIFRADKRRCTLYQVKFSYKNTDYTVWSELVSLNSVQPDLDKVYFSNIRPKATASLRPMSVRGKGIIVLAIICFILSAFCFYKHFLKLR